MSKQLILDYIPFQVSTQQINESLENNDGRLIVNGTLQRADANLNNVSHNILEMHWDKDDLVGTVEVLSTPSGNILKELFKSGIRLGISSRGMGSVKEVMTEAGAGLELQVQPDFELIGFDFVSNPSTHGAFLSPVNESAGSKSVTDPYLSINRMITDIIKEF